MNSKQTAVEWLVEQMIERKYFAKDVPLSYTTLEHLVNQAKEMEKEQMKEIAWHFRDIDMSKKNKGLVIDLEFEQYYNETFKSE